MESVDGARRMNTLMRPHNVYLVKMEALYKSSRQAYQSCISGIAVCKSLVARPRELLMYDSSAAGLGQGKI